MERSAMCPPQGHWLILSCKGFLERERHCTPLVYMYFGSTDGLGFEISGQGCDTEGGHWGFHWLQERHNQR